MQERAVHQRGALEQLLLGSIVRRQVTELHQPGPLTARHDALVQPTHAALAVDGRESVQCPLVTRWFASKHALAVRLHLHLDRERATISLDLGGGSLHERGYRRDGGQAPLKENLAAALLLRAGWARLAAEGAAFCDPMCGSGTLATEAAAVFRRRM